MRYYPVNLDIRGKAVVVVGGGAVAARKGKRLAQAGAVLTVVAPELHPLLAELCAAEKARHLPRHYRPGDLAGAFLAFAATSDPEVNRAVAEEAHECGILVDVVDAPAAGDFTTPAALSRGDLLITVSTGGVSPALSRRIVRELEPRFGEEYAEALELLGRVREKILTAKGSSEYNGRVFSELAALDIPALIKNGSRDEVDQLLLKLLGDDLARGPGGAAKEDPS